MSIAIGIDLGTTNSCAAWYEDGSVKIIENEEQEAVTPSFVYYDADETTPIVGKIAEHRSAINPTNGIFDSKRMLGHKFDDKQIQENLTKWPFKVTKADNGEPQIEIKRNDEILKIRPEEVSAAILNQLRKLACKKLDENVVNAVITVPAYFSNAQRQTTKDAAKIAGLNVFKLINEPTAAAFAFIDKNRESKDRTVLVYDLGGGTFDVSLIKFCNNNMNGEVLSISGDTLLGGRDFDNNLSSYFLEEIEKIYDVSLGQDSENKRRNSRRVRTQCEHIKKTLSERNKATLLIDEFLGHDVNITVTREQFEKLNETLFERTIQIVDEVLQNAEINKDKIDEIVLVGGSTRIPKIQQLLQDYFGGKVLNKSVNPDEAVARGAAIQAALLNDNPDQKIDEYSLIDVTPFSLGTAVFGNIFSVIIKKNTKIPVSLEQRYVTVWDNQTSVGVSIYEGESNNVKDNILLGAFVIKNITPKPKGEVKIDVRFEIDSNGILNAKATESSKNISKNLNIVLDNGRFTDEQIEQLQAKFQAKNDDSD